ncbi:MAG TPA: cadherin-like beta sandwich domain-containing protein [Nitrospira sp.]|jgi:hypothetical protein|nr:cadherin-like beta sandwich domain-containing protein [Nitrospira sp.]
MRFKTACTLKRTHRFIRGCVAVALLVASAYGCSDSATVNPEVELGSLTVDSGTLQPAFSSTTTEYSVELPNNVTSLTITAQPRVDGDTVNIDGQTTTRRSITPAPVGAPPTVVNIVVSESTAKSRTYTVVFNRIPLAANNDLSALTVAPGTLSPAFGSGQLNYTVDVATDVTSVSVSATKADPNAVISGDVPNQGQAIIPLDGPGTTKDLFMTVTAQNGNAKIYRVTIKRAAPTDNNNLSALTVAPGSLTPGFSPNILEYDVSSSAGSLTVSATKSDPNAVMSGSVTAGTGVPTGQATVPLGGPGIITRISITVTAPNGDSKSYVITVSRPFR